MTGLNLYLCCVQDSSTGRQRLGWITDAVILSMQSGVEMQKVPQQPNWITSCSQPKGSASSSDMLSLLHHKRTLMQDKIMLKRVNVLFTTQHPSNRFTVLVLRCQLPNLKSNCKPYQEIGSSKWKEDEVAIPDQIRTLFAATVTVFRNFPIPEIHAHCM